MNRPALSDEIHSARGNVRQCNTQRTVCSLGLVTLNSELKILSVGDATTKLQITVDYKVSPEGVETWREVSSRPSSREFEIIHDQGTVSRTAEIPYGEVRHVELPYGLSYTLCASAPGVTTKSTRPCANQLNVKDPFQRSRDLTRVAVTVGSSLRRLSASQFSVLDICNGSENR